jgi:hypothetical protein
VKGRCLIISFLFLLACVARTVDARVGPRVGAIASQSKAEHLPRGITAARDAMYHVLLSRTCNLPIMHAIRSSIPCPCPPQFPHWPVSRAFWCPSPAQGQPECQSDTTATAAPTHQFPRSSKERLPHCARLRTPAYTERPAWAEASQFRASPSTVSLAGYSPTCR